jgi:hypothetical protein
VAFFLALLLLWQKPGAFMTYRIDSAARSPGATITFQGRLDEAALAALRDRLEAVGGQARLLLLDGTELEPRCLAPLLALPGLRLTAASPFLTRLISEERP